MAEFSQSLCKAAKILENNQYPSTFYEPLIAKALEKCYGKDKENNDHSLHWGLIPAT